jgi:phosphatidate phosphatase APP1
MGADGTAKGTARGMAREWARAATRMLGLLARPVRTAHGERGVVLQPYRGYGSRAEVFLIGRVFRQSRPRGEGEAGAEEAGLARQLRDVGRRIARRAVPGAVVRARFQGAEGRFETDGDGYFRVTLAPRDPPPQDRAWHPMELELEGPVPARAVAEVFVPSGRCRCVVVSDIDDTIMRTGVANKAKMLWRLFVQDAESRVAFPGAAALYRALHDGAGGDEGNPMLYVSRAPWGIYDVLEEFFEGHGIPVGPILFLREWGVSWRSPLPRRAEDHKQELIRNMLALYDGLPVVLIGDSGQHDPEVYRQIVEENPGRIPAVLIRNVSWDERRIREIEALGAAVAAAGSSLVLAADSAAMAEHLARLGLVAPEAVGRVRAEMEEAGAGKAARTLRVGRPSPGGAARAVARGELGEAVRAAPEDAPPNVVLGRGGEGGPPRG